MKKLLSLFASIALFLVVFAGLSIHTTSPVCAAMYGGCTGAKAQCPSGEAINSCVDSVTIKGSIAIIGAMNPSATITLSAVYKNTDVNVCHVHCLLRQDTWKGTAISRSYSIDTLGCSSGYCEKDNGDDVTIFPTTSDKNCSAKPVTITADNNGHEDIANIIFSCVPSDGPPTGYFTVSDASQLTLVRTQAQVSTSVHFPDAIFHDEGSNLKQVDTLMKPYNSSWCKTRYGSTNWCKISSDVFTDSKDHKVQSIYLDATDLVNNTVPLGTYTVALVAYDSKGNACSGDPEGNGQAPWYYCDKTFTHTRDFATLTVQASIPTPTGTPPVTPTPTKSLLPTATPTKVPTPTLTVTPTPTPPQGNQRYSISGTVFKDNNSNGIKDSGETSYSESSSVIEFHIGSDTTLCDPANGNHQSSLVSYVGNGGIITTNTGVYDTQKKLPQGKYTVCYVSLPRDAGYHLTTTSVFIKTLGPDSPNTNFGINKNNTSAWIQGFCSDMKKSNGFTNIIPGCATDKYTILSDNLTCSDTSKTGAGIVYTSENATIDFGLQGGKASVHDWRAKIDMTEEKTSPTHFSYEAIDGLTKKNEDRKSLTSPHNYCEGGLSNCTLESTIPSGTYTTDSDVVLTSSVSFTPKTTYIFLINGNLTIKGNILVPVGGVALFVVKGNLIIDKGVTRLDGYYSTNSTMLIDGNGEDCSETADVPLKIHGALIINAGLQGGVLNNARNLCNTSCAPSLVLSPRLDFFFALPAVLQKKNFIWREVAP